MRVQNVHQSLSGCQNVCTERHQPRILFADIKSRVPNVYRSQIAFPDVNTRVQNSHTAFPVVSKQTSTTLIVLPGLEMHVQNVYHRHKAFPDVKTFVQNVYQPHIRFPDIKTRVSRPQISFPDVNTRVQHFSHQHFHKRLTERTSTIVTKPFWMSKRLHKTSTNLTYAFPDIKTCVPSDYRPQIALSTHSLSGYQNEWLPP